MKNKIVCMLSMVALFCGMTTISGCSNTKPNVRMALSEISKRPDVFMNPPYIENGNLYFPAESDVYATSRLSKEKAERDAMIKMSRYLGSIIFDKVEEVRIESNLSRNIIDPSLAERSFSRLFSQNLIVGARPKQYFTEVVQIDDRQGYLTCVLMELDLNGPAKSYQETINQLIDGMEERDLQAKYNQITMEKIAGAKKAFGWIKEEGLDKALQDKGNATQ